MLSYNVYLWAQPRESETTLWEALYQISLSTHGAWCLLGDFNTILSKEDRYGGNHVEDHDIQELTNFMANCEVLEMPSLGAFFTWTNKTIWSKIDRVFINIVWHEDATRAVVEGFDQVGDVMLSFYKDLLGQTSLQRHPIDPGIVLQGKVLSPEQQIDLYKPFTDKDIKDALFSIPNVKSPGPDGALVEKITNRVHIWATRNLSFAGRAMLINGVIFGMFNYWASIFLLRQNMLEKITTICRNYLWGGTEEHTKVPHISWANTYKAKKHRGIGIKDYVAWNKATIAKLVWTVATKKDTLWVKWVYGRYIKDTDWWDYAPAPGSSWTWKKICSTKETFKPDCHNSHDWQFQGRNVFKVSTGYQWLVEGTKVSWDKVVWARASIPRHAFITWVYVQHRLPIKARLNRFIPQSDLQCLLCNNTIEEDTHLFTECLYAIEVSDSLMQWWPIPCRNTYADLTASLSRYRAPKAQKQISCTIFAAAIYFI
ncbi:hypothetical protein Cgig2_003526 [Carnegiea gigantea]|uniref:Reverse transcriptase zinc-binding domain-containing protein n=1 Tax=Carnegiea gigantea TaxID=171969 RepID=A0A9Q1GP65_9CARY|nr:hypothetical protein Cgig2_003526 [Carnegiea gigantea]